MNEQVVLNVDGLCMRYGEIDVGMIGAPIVLRRTASRESGPYVAHRRELAPQRVG